MNTIAKSHYDQAVAWLGAADDVGDVNSALCYTGMGQLSLELAKFAVDHHALVMGIDEDIPGQPVMPAGPPMSGPKLWGAP